MHNKYKVLEWNIHKMTKNKLVAPFVVERITQDKPDIIVLVEYKSDYNIEQALSEDYYIHVSIGRNGNDVLMAIKKCIVLEEAIPKFNSSIISISLGKDAPTVLAATFQTKERKTLSIIGLRYVAGGNAIKVSKYLKSYLDRLDHEFICTGDFNIREDRMLMHYGEYYHEKYDETLKNSSIIMLNNFKDCIITGFQRMDHIVYSSNIKKESLSYSWDFVEKSEVYPPYSEIAEGYLWRIPVAYPDHAILEFEFHLNT